MKPNSMVILTSNERVPVNADAFYPFKQNSDIFYLSGIDQEETMLILAPDFPDPKLREVLFLKPTSESIAIWEGQKLSLEAGSALSGIETVRWSHEFDFVCAQLARASDHIYLLTHEESKSGSYTGYDRLVEDCRRKFPLHQYERFPPLIHDLRQVKKEPEIDQIKKAIAITDEGFKKVLAHTRPGLKEYELEALFSQVFLSRGSRGFGYDPIVASGGNSCILHYTANDNVLRENALVLMDIGAEYGNYNADITRTLPVSGKFTARQKAVYESVLFVKKQATGLLKPGTVLKDYQEEVGQLVEEQLLKLGVLQEEEVRQQDPVDPLYKRYFMHGTSHHLGLDVHDPGSRFRPLEPGMVLTVEPGIYLKEEGFGIRLEDDILVTEGEPVNLSAAIPIEIEEIEDLMHGNNS